MSKQKGDPMAALSPPFQDVERPSWLSEREETEILGRVETDLVHAFRETFQERQEAVPSQGASMLLAALQRWTLVGASAAAAGALLFYVTKPTPLPALSVKGVALSATQQKAPDVSFQMEAAHAGHVAESKRWDMQMGRTAQLALRRVGHDKRIVRLKRGFVQVHVVPGQVRQFSVESAGYKVLVKGTIFSVEREKGWLRVEVSRGKVALRGPSQKDIFIKKGEGVRVNLQTKKLERYARPAGKAPQSTLAEQLKARVGWLATRPPKENLLFALDLAKSQRYPKALRKGQIEEIERRLYRTKAHASALKLKLVLTDMQKTKSESAIYFVNAVTDCYKNNLPFKRCEGLHRTFSKRFPKHRSLTALYKQARQMRLSRTPR
jgi:hypothetical protein